jgi:DNA topoisomerase-6 subunit B
VFLRRRERAQSEFRRRNIFDLYIEEVVQACGRLKGAGLSKEKLRSQLMKMAVKRTGGSRTDEILGKDGGPEGLPHSIIVTAEGTEGEAPSPPEGERAEGAPAENGNGADGGEAPGGTATRRGRKGPARPAAAVPAPRAKPGKPGASAPASTRRKR